MIKLTKQVESLERVLDRFEEKIDTLIDMKAALEVKADRHGRQMTVHEQERYAAIDEKIRELEHERKDVESAIGYLGEYI